MSAGQAAGTHCALSESCVGTTTQRVSCDLGVLALWLGSEIAVNLPFGADYAQSGTNAFGLVPTNALMLRDLVNFRVVGKSEAMPAPCGYSSEK